MSEQNTGGPAFPAGILTDARGLIVGGGFGMTLRDYFAAKATDDDVNEHIWKGYKEDFVTSDGQGHKRVVQRQAMYTREQAKYRYADAMLKAREQ